MVSSTKRSRSCVLAGPIVIVERVVPVEEVGTTEQEAGSEAEVWMDCPLLQWAHPVAP